MKNLLYTILAATVLLFASCSSDNDNMDSGSDNGTNNVKQTVSLEIKTLSSLNTRSTTDNVQINKIIYALYKLTDTTETGYETLEFADSLIITENTIPNITFDLAEGKYKVAIFASSRRSAKLYSTNNYILGRSYVVVDDTSNPNEFLGTTTIEVGNQPIRQSVQLDRAVGKVEIVITDLDKLPSSIQSISVRIETLSQIYQVWTTTAPWLLGFTDERYAIYDRKDINVPLLTRDQFSKHGVDNPIYFYSLQTGNSDDSSPNTTSGGDLYLYLNKTNEKPAGLATPNDKVLVSKSVKIYPNKISRFTGRLMGDEHGFSLSVNQDWDEDVNIIEVNDIDKL